VCVFVCVYTHIHRPYMHAEGKPGRHVTSVQFGAVTSGDLAIESFLPTRVKYKAGS
jgi:hypothetical protein